MARTVLVSWGLAMALAGAGREVRRSGLKILLWAAAGRLAAKAETAAAGHRVCWAR